MYVYLMDEGMWWTCPMASSGLDRLVSLCKPWIFIYSFPFFYLSMLPLPFLNHLFCVQTYMYTYVCIQIHMLVHVKNRCYCSVSSLSHPCFEGSLNELGLHFSCTEIYMCARNPDSEPHACTHAFRHEHLMMGDIFLYMDLHLAN